MHKVKNNGSALQTYALLSKIKDLGYDCEIIDYVFPNEMVNKTNMIIKTQKKLMIFFSDLILGFPLYCRQKRFLNFYKNYYILSEDTYQSKEQLHNNPPEYNFLITGSDQVWNPKHIKEDTSFMLSFCKNNSIPRISYSASFAVNELPQEFRALYAELLSKYNYISVRESSGIKIIRDLIQRESTVTCDPTLLLNKRDWSKISNKSQIYVKKPYILAYILGYTFNPYPKVYSIIEKIQNQTGLQVVFLNGRISECRRKNTTVYRDIGPIEFVRLFMDAEYIITTSLHGTAFALNFSKPFNSVIQSSGNDRRLLDLLESVGASDRIVDIESGIVEFQEMDYRTVEEKLEDLRIKSIDFLRNSLNMKYNR